MCFKLLDEVLRCGYIKKSWLLNCSHHPLFLLTVSIRSVLDRRFFKFLTAVVRFKGYKKTRTHVKKKKCYKRHV